MVVEHKPSGTLVDVTLNNLEPAFIARFVKISVAAHPLVKMLILSLKKWFNDQEVKKSMLPSVSSALMGISYLQEKKYLPPLPTMVRNTFLMFIHCYGSITLTFLQCILGISWFKTE